MGSEKVDWVRWNALVTLVNCDSSCSCHWVSRWNWRISIAIVLVLACVVMYDATGERLHAGRRAEANQIVCELPPEHPVSSVKPLRDLLGHTPIQVLAGAVLGCVVSYLMRNPH